MASQLSLAVSCAQWPVVLGVHLTWGMSLVASVSGLCVLSSSLVWATLRGACLALMAAWGGRALMARG